MIARHYDFENRIVAGDDLTFKRIGESSRCCSQQAESHETSHCEHLHDLTDKHIFCFGHRNPQWHRAYKDATARSTWKNHAASRDRALQ
jgi:hypothetical protein